MHKTPDTYLVDEHANLRVDYIGCYERYEEIYDFTRKRSRRLWLCKTCCNAKWHNHGQEKLNQKSEMDWRLIYEQQENTNEVLDMVYDFYDWDFETFGYNKDWQVEDDSLNVGFMSNQYRCI